MILITGGSGQLGKALQKQLKSDYAAPQRCALDITDRQAVEDYIARYRPEAVVNCAAYNFVDLAETNEKECMRVNAEAVLDLARSCKKYGSYLIHISSDYVFDGAKNGEYEITDKVSPLSVYGRSKALGEEYTLSTSADNAVVRISWLFSEYDNNFVNAIINAGSKHSEINVVCDQIGSPTYAPDLAVLLCGMLEKRPSGIFHATNEGICTRSQFAGDILKYADIPCDVKEITSELYPSAAKRPKNSVLSKVSLDRAGLARLPDWQDALARCIAIRKAKNTL